MTRKEFLAASGATLVASAFGGIRAVRRSGSSVPLQGKGFPSWLEPKIEAALVRYKEWKGSEEVVVFTLTTDLHDWHPAIDSDDGPDVSSKMHIPYALHVGDVFEADFAADLGDIGSDWTVGKDGALVGATREEMLCRRSSQVELYDKARRPVFQCVGNHDLTYVVTENGVAKWRNDDPRNFGNCFAPLAHGAEVVWGEGRDYGYWDVPGKNFRVIVLDSFEWAHTYGFKPSQLAFLSGALVVPPDFAVVVLMHSDLQPPMGCWLHNGVMQFRNSFSADRARFGHKEAQRMLEDFVGRGRGESNGLAWDFTSLRNNRLAAVLCGHAHYDNFLRQYDVLHVVRQGHGSINARTEFPHENGARHTEVSLSDDTCIDVVAVKPKLGDLAIFRIGAGDELADFKEDC